MRTIVCSDFHLNIKNRLDDFTISMTQVSSYAIKHKVDTVIFLGDAFHKRRPHPIEMRRFEWWVKSIIDANIELIMVLGNHDMTTDTNTIQYFDILETKNVKVVKPPLIHKGIYYDHILLKESKMGALGYQKRIDSKSYKDLIKQYPKVKAFILGHIHKPQVINKKPLVMHVGSIDRVDFGERDEDKYFLDINNGKLKLIKLNIRPMIQIEVNLFDDIDRNTFYNVFKKYDIKPIIKIVLKGTKEQVEKCFRNLDVWNNYRKETYNLKVKVDLIRKKHQSKTTISEDKSVEDNFIEYAKINKLDKSSIELGKRIIQKLK
ncbi:MAG: exonuclease SbcCD subunit D [Candidatus Hodarchaeota archaeon]